MRDREQKGTLDIKGHQICESQKYTACILQIISFCLVCIVHRIFARTHTSLPDQFIFCIYSVFFSFLFWGSCRCYIKVKFLKERNTYWNYSIDGVTSQKFKISSVCHTNQKWNEMWKMKGNTNKVFFCEKRKEDGKSYRTGWGWYLQFDIYIYYRIIISLDLRCITFSLSHPLFGFPSFFSDMFTLFFTKKRKENIVYIYY